MAGLVVCCALVFSLGLVGALRTVTDSGRGRSTGTRAPASDSEHLSRGTAHIRRVVRRVGKWRLASAVVVGLIAWLVTGWPVGFALGSAASFGLPSLLGSGRAAISTAKAEAVAAWTEMLQATLAASAGLSEAILATAHLVPEAIREPTMALAGRLASGVDTRSALLRFANDLDDPSADRVVCALILAAEARAQRLGELLSALADSTRAEVAARLRVDVSRASVRSGVRTVIVFSIGFATLLVVAARTYLQPFDTPMGQIVLTMVGGLYAGGLSLLVIMSRPPEPVRLLKQAVAHP